MKMIKNPLLASVVTMSLLTLSGSAQSAPAHLLTGGEFEEGTETHFTSTEIDTLLPWARNSEIEIRKLLESVAPLHIARKRDRLLDGIRQIVRDSGPLQTELLMRFALNRALKIDEVLREETDPNLPGVVDTEVHLLHESLLLALKYYRSDVNFLSGANSRTSGVETLRPTAEFGLEYASFLMRLVAGITDATAQYRVGLLTLGFLQKDLDRDVNRLVQAPAIQAIHRYLSVTPESAPYRDQDAVSGIREMLQVYGSAVKLVTPVR